MNFKDLATKIADASPILGGLLAGPGGALVGGWIAKKFGTSTTDPASIFSVLEQDAQWQFKIKELEVEKALEIERLQTQITLAEIQAQVSNIQAVNETMRAESSSDDLWQKRWRPFIGFVFGGSFAVVTVWVCYLMYLSLFEGRQDAMRAIPDLVNTFTTLFAIPGAILGVSAWGRNQLKLKRDVKQQ